MSGLIKVSMGQPLGPCRLCGARDGQTVTVHRSAAGALSFLRCAAFSDGRVVEAALLHCGPCDFAYFSPCPDAEFIDAYYRSQAGQGGEPSAETLRARLRGWATAREVESVAAFLAGHGVLLDPGAQALAVDVGAGAGEFSAYLHGRGVEVVAIEPGRANARFIAEEIGCAVANCNLEKMPEEYAGRASLVHCKDSLEHHADPAGSLAAMARLLAPGGRLFLSVPNWNSR
ncbi:MAG: class I SAM-dependent methyltransferase, partial [Rhodocyclaceae bacterium]|nr:class I SAM-dependent methyltransferase [Rhodocyclaceae bacterium]